MSGLGPSTINAYIATKVKFVTSLDILYYCLLLGEEKSLQILI